MHWLSDESGEVRRESGGEKVNGKGKGFMAGKEWIVVGHSVGASMAVMLGMETPSGGRWSVPILHPISEPLPPHSHRPISMLTPNST